MEHKFSSVNQYLAAITVNLATMSYGSAVGWVSPSLPMLLSETNTPLHNAMTEEEASLVGGLLCIGALVGVLTTRYVADAWGRKYGGYLIALPILISWGFIIYAKAAIHVLVGRFLVGFGGGGILLLAPLFIAEIAEDRIRGSLGSLLVLSANVGVGFAYFVGPFVGYQTFGYILATVIFIFVPSFYMLPETPVFLMKNDKEQEAVASLKWYRGLHKHVELSTMSNCELKMEVEKLRSFTASSKNAKKIKVEDFMNKPAIRGLTIGITLMFMQQFDGQFAIVSYAENIFEQAGSTIPPYQSAIILGILQVLGSYSSTFLVERAGRKFLLISSAVLVGLCLLTLGTFSYVLLIGYDVSSYGWIPVIALPVAVFAHACGLGPIPFVIVSEIFSEKIRGIAALVCVFLLWVFGFIILQYFQSMAAVWGIHGCFWFFSACMAGGTIFIYFCVPETRGRSLDSITRELE